MVPAIRHRADRPGACILIEADSEEQVRQKLNTLPMVQAGMLYVTIIPLKPYAGFKVNDLLEMRRIEARGVPVLRR